MSLASVFSLLLVGLVCGQQAPATRDLIDPPITVTQASAVDQNAPATIEKCVKAQQLFSVRIQAFKTSNGTEFVRQLVDSLVFECWNNYKNLTWTGVNNLKDCGERTAKAGLNTFHLEDGVCKAYAGRVPLTTCMANGDTVVYTARTPLTKFLPTSIALTDVDVRMKSLTLHAFIWSPADGCAYFLTGFELYYTDVRRNGPSVYLPMTDSGTIIYIADLVTSCNDTMYWEIQPYGPNNETIGGPVIGNKTWGNAVMSRKLLKSDLCVFYIGNPGRHEAIRVMTEGCKFIDPNATIIDTKPKFFELGQALYDITGQFAVGVYLINGTWRWKGDNAVQSTDDDTVWSPGANWTDSSIECTKSTNGTPIKLLTEPCYSTLGGYCIYNI